MESCISAYEAVSESLVRACDEPVMEDFGLAPT